MGTRSAQAQSSPDRDLAILNFALQLEYLEAEYYLFAVRGQGLSAGDTNGEGSRGSTLVTANAKVNFETQAFRDYAEEIAEDEFNHVKALRALIRQLGGRQASKPLIDLKASFAGLGDAIGVPGFDPFANEVNFLLGAFVFEDVGVTAYGGAAALINQGPVLTAAAKILSVEAYHAGAVRTVLYSLGDEVRQIAGRISDVRASLGAGRDEGITRGRGANLVPTDSDSLTHVRTTRQVLNIVYGRRDAPRGLFFPRGMNGAITK